MPNLVTDPSEIIRLLEKKERASAVELGTDVPTMKLLEQAGAVRTDGTISTGKRGRPPAAWVIENAEAELPEIVEREPRQKRNGDGVTQAQIDRSLADIKETAWAKHCSCVCKLDTIEFAEIRALGHGCSGEQWPGKPANGRTYAEMIMAYGPPRKTWVCPALDALRRRIGL